MSFEVENARRNRPDPQSVFINGLLASSTDNVEQIVFRLAAPVDMQALESAWRAITARHAILHTGFETEPEDGTTATRKAVLPEVSVVDWSDAAGEEELRQRLERFLEEDRRRRFDLLQPPLLRIMLARLPDGSCQNVLSLCHGLLDWRSLSTLLRELANERTLETRGEVAAMLGAGPVKLGGGFDTAFWQDYLRDFDGPHEIELPRDAGTADDGSAPPAVEVRLKDAEGDRVRRLRKAAGVTLNNLVQAAWALMRTHYTGVNDAVFGITRSCRGSGPPGAEDAIGAFTNVIPLRVRVNPEQNVFELLWHVRDQHRRVREHECAPLPLVEQCAGPGETRRLFDSVLEFDLRDPMQALEELFAGDGVSGFRHYAGAWAGLNLQVFGEDDIAIRLKYQPEKFDARAARQLLEHFTSLLMAMAREPWAPVKEIPFLGDAEREPCRWPGSRELAADGKAETLHGRFRQQAEKTPAAVAVACGEEHLTYSELDDLSNRLAARLRALGARPDTLVGLCAERSLDLIVGLLGILKSGAGYLPLDPDYPPERLRFLLEDSGTSIVVAPDGARGKLPGDLQFVAPRAGGEADVVPEETAAAEHLAYVIYTSGSTGQPKGVQVTHRNVARLFDACQSWLAAGNGDVWTMFHSFAFDFSVWEIWGALLHGGRLEIVPKDVARSPELFHALLAERGVTVLNQTPSAFAQLMKADAQGSRDLSALRLVVFGGEQLDVGGLLPWFERHGDASPRLVNMYGITETTVHVTYRPILKKDAEAYNAASQGSPVGSPIGVPLTDLYVRLLDADGRPVPPGVPGEICVGGAGVTRGYLNRPELNAKHFVPDPHSDDSAARLYRSGDFARQLPNGELQFLGRRDDQVKVRGYRIDLGEISATVRRLPDVDDGIAVVREARQGGRRIIVYYVTANDSLTEARLREALREKLPAHMLPAALIRIPRIPVNANNKVDFKALPDIADADAAFGSKEQPETPAERALAEIWSAVLERPHIGRNDDFFGLGGDSILAVQVVARARAAGIEITPRDIFNHSNLAALAQVARQAPAEQGEGAALKLEGPCGLTPVQHWFFEQRLEKPDHCNQARLFRVPPECQVELLERACREVVRQHDAMRVRFSRSESGRWQGGYVRPEEAFEFSRVELDHLEIDERREALRLITNDIRESLSIASGLLMRVAHFTGGLEDGDRLLIVIHQLAIDAASWDIFLQDLDTAYRRLLAGKEPVLPVPALRYGQWAERLQRHAQSPSVIAEQPFWRQVMDAPAGDLWPAANGNGFERDAVTVQMTLDAPDTAALLGSVHEAYGTQVNDILLAGFAQACARQWPEYERLRIDVEHDARNGAIKDDFAGVDLSRTVGWFHTVAPLALDLTKTGSPAKLICDMKARLHGSAHNGLGYGLLRYLHPSGTAMSRGSQHANIRFHYAGRRESSFDGGLFQRVSEDMTAWRPGSNPLTHGLSVKGAVHDDRMQFTFRFSPEVIPQDRVQALADNYRQTLKELITHCRTRERAARTPEDFPLARLSQEELDAFPVSFEQTEDVLPLSPLQRLYHALSGTDKDVGFDQWVFHLEGSIDERAFEEAWRELFRRHEALRSVIVDRGLNEPHQAILRDVDFRLQRTDWRLLSPEDQRKRLEEFLAADRREGFDPAIAPLTRVTLIRTAAAKWIVVWSHWQGQVDGWSWPILSRELGEIHDAIAAGRKPALAPAGSYRAYIAWLMARDLDEYAAFWREHLGLGRGARTLISKTRRRADGYRGPQRTTHKRIELTADLSRSIGRFARELKLTPSVVFQAAWALLLSGMTSRFDVTLGVAFSGRTAGIPIAENTVGPFVNDLPVRVRVAPTERIDAWLAGMRGLQADLNHYQNVSPTEIHRWSGNASAGRLFDTLLVFQNYVTGTAAKRWGEHIGVQSFTAGVRTNYPLSVAVTPGERYRVDFYYDETVVERDTVKALARHLVTVLNVVTNNPDVHVDTILKHIAAAQDERVRAAQEPPRPGRWNRRATDRIPADDQPASAFAPRGRDSMEGRVAEVCREVLDLPDIRLEANFFELGAQSVSMIEIHARLQRDLDRNFPIVKLFEHPSVASLARYLEQGDPDDGLWNVSRRGAARREALQRRRQAYQSGRQET